MSRKKPEKKEISQEWLTTYSDMVTLILTFFVLLYSFSLLDKNKFKAIATSLADALNNGKAAVFQLNDSSGDIPIIGNETPDVEVPQSTPPSSDSYSEMYDRVSRFVEGNSLGEYVSIREGDRGIIIEFKDKILFDAGRADIKDEGIPTLMKISELIRGINNPIVIEGHTDNVPIHTAEFPSNMELSSARAMKVRQYLTEDRGLNPDRFSVAAYGEYSPISGNDTPEGRAQNRRVNILIVTPKGKS